MLCPAELTLNSYIKNIEASTDRSCLCGFDQPIHWVIGFLLILFALSATGCGSERAKWSLAESENLYEDGDLAGAVAALEKTAELAPNDENIKLHLAQRYAENGQYELGLGICNEYIKSHPDDVRGYHTRFNCHLFKSNFSEALADYKKSLSANASRSLKELNNLAYFRGLAEEEIDKAAIEIQTAINKIEKSGNWGSPLRITLQARALVVAGLISRHIDQQQVALIHLDKKINSYELEIDAQTVRLKRLVAGEIHRGVPFGKNIDAILLKTRGRIENVSTHLAALLATRALVYEDLGEHEKADTDRLKLEQLNFKFEDFVRRLPSDSWCVHSLSSVSMYLDTRGFVLGRQTWAENDPLWTMIGGSEIPPLAVSNYESALEDLDLAILASRFYELAIDTSLYNTPEFSAKAISQEKRSAKRSTAVLLHHRREIHLRGGNQEAAAKDEKEIEQLGFKGCSLF